MSIAKKITLVVSLFAGALVGAAAYTGQSLQVREWRNQVRAQTQLLARMLKLAVESTLTAGPGGPTPIRNLESLVSKGTQARITIFGLDARPVMPPDKDPVINTRVLRVIERNQSEEDLELNAYAYRLPLHFQGKVAGALEMRVDLKGLLPAEGSPTAAIVIGGLFMIFVALTGIFSRTSIGRPIDQLMGGMDHIIRGDLTVALPIDRNDEVGRIAYRFNEMTAQLRDAQELIRRGAQAKLELEQRLRQSEKLATIGQLSAEIAHEVGTPLNVIGGRARTLERKAEQPAEVLKNSQIIADQAERITKIIQRMLDLSRARVPEKTKLDIRRIIKDALAFLEYQVERSRVNVVDEATTVELPTVQGDGDGLQQVFINLIMNALQAMPDGGTLAVRARAETRRKEGLEVAAPQEFVLVEVADTGPGIPEEQQSRIFEPFYSTKRKGEGTGLGLTVVHGIVKDHDGWIEVQSAKPHGTLFRVYLPTEEQRLPHHDDTGEIRR
jgi:signal transduction histidine kinase